MTLVSEHGDSRPQEIIRDGEKGGGGWEWGYGEGGAGGGSGEGDYN